MFVFVGGLEGYIQNIDILPLYGRSVDEELLMVDATMDGSEAQSKAWPGLGKNIGVIQS